MIGVRKLRIRLGEYSLLPEGCFIYNKRTVEISVVPGEVEADGSIRCRSDEVLSHAGYFENGNSPVMVMTVIINSLNSLVQLCIPVQRSALVTVIHAQLGERAFGTTPGYAHVMATMRAYEAADLETMKSKANEIAEGIARSYGLQQEIEWVEDYPAMLNDERLTDELSEIGKKLDLHIIHRDNPFSWSEDFARFREKSPALLIGLGSGNDSPQLHNADYDFPDELIETGLKVFTELIDKLGGS